MATQPVVCGGHTYHTAGVSDRVPRPRHTPTPSPALPLLAGISEAPALIRLLATIQRSARVVRSALNDYRTELISRSE
ncbi:unnamed protein product, partial [Iphiclides podalirius]